MTALPLRRRAAKRIRGARRYFIDAMKYPHRRGSLPAHALSILPERVLVWLVKVTPEISRFINVDLPT